MSDSDGFDVVKRPPRSTGAIRKMPPGLYDEIMATLKNGKAVRVPLNGRPRALIHNRIRQALTSRGVRPRVQRDGDAGTHLIVWVEPR